MLTTELSRPPVTLVFTTGRDAFQMLVASTTKSKATHAAIGLGDQLLHAYENGVLLESRDEWLGKREQKLVAEFEILPDVSEGVGQALAHVGEKYDVAHVFKAWILRLLSPAIRSLGPDSRNKFTCARFVTLIDPHGDRIPEWRYLWREALAPVDLLDAAMWGPSFRRLS